MVYKIIPRLMSLILFLFMIMKAQTYNNTIYCHYRYDWDKQIPQSWFDYYGYTNNSNTPQELAKSMMDINFGGSLFQNSQSVGNYSGCPLMVTGLHGSYIYGQDTYYYIYTDILCFEFYYNGPKRGSIICRHNEKLVTIVLPPSLMETITEVDATHNGAITLTTNNNRLKIRVNGDGLLMIQNNSGALFTVDYYPNFNPAYEGAQGNWNNSGNSNLFLYDDGGFGVYLMESQPTKTIVGDVPKYSYPVSNQRVFWTGICPPKNYNWELSKKRIILKGGDSLYSHWYYDAYLQTKTLDFYGNKGYGYNDRSVYGEYDIFALVGDVTLWGDSKNNCWHNNFIPRPGWATFDSTIELAQSLPHKKQVLFYICPQQFYSGSRYWSSSPYYLNTLIEFVYTPPLGIHTLIPQNPEGENIDSLYAAVQRMVTHLSRNTNGTVDGLYIDGLYTSNIPQSYILIRKIRKLLDCISSEKRIILHSSPSPGGEAHLPQIEAYADFVLRGEGTSEHYNDDRYWRYYVGTYNISNSVGIALWDDYDLAQKKGANYSLDPYISNGIYKTTFINRVLDRFNLRLRFQHDREDYKNLDPNSLYSRYSPTIISSQYFSNMQNLSESNFAKNGWYPASISGPSDVYHPNRPGQIYLYSWNASQSGTAPFTYVWKKYGYQVGNNSSSYSESFGFDGYSGGYTNFNLSVTITDYKGHVSNSNITVGEYHSGSQPLPKQQNNTNLKQIPTEYVIRQNFPNPFNPITNISYEIPELSDVKITVYDQLGREVEVLVNQIQEPGYYNVSFNAASLCSGIYFYKINAGQYFETKKMALIK